MLSIEKCREILGNPDLSDQDIDRIQKQLRLLVNVVLDEIEEKEKQ